MSASATRASLTTIPALSAALDDLAAGQAAAGDRRAYFSGLYGLMTHRVARGIADRRFEDGARMERLACHFAARYFAALDRHSTDGAAPASWEIAFAAAARWRPIILQHLVLGMNAHINFDLGIAAAEVADDHGLAAVRRDFLEINAVLAELLGDVQDRLATVSPWMGMLDRVAGRKDEKIVNFSMQRARDAAWSFAERYAPLDRSARERAAQSLDQQVARFAHVIIHPGRLVTVAAVPVRLRERASVEEVLRAFAPAGDAS